MGTILNDIKKMLGVGSDDTNFDIEITMHINSTITSLTQLGVGPKDGFIITEATDWPELIGDRKDLENIKTYIYLEVRLVFDPPQNSFLVAAIEKQCQKYEFRIQVQASPSTTAPVTDTPVNDSEFAGYPYYD